MSKTSWAAACLVLSGCVEQTALNPVPSTTALYFRNLHTTLTSSTIIAERNREEVGTAHAECGFQDEAKRKLFIRLINGPGSIISFKLSPIGVPKVFNEDFYRRINQEISSELFQSDLNKLSYDRACPNGRPDADAIKAMLQDLLPLPYPRM